MKQFAFCRRMHARRWMEYLVVAAVGLGWSGGPVNGAILVVTSLEGQAIQQVDTVTNAITTILNTSPAQTDSLVFDPSGRIVYTRISTGQVALFNPITSSNTVIASGLNGPRDVALEPSGTSVLVSDTGNGRIVRINLLTNTLTVLKTGISPDGIVYDSLGNLFAVLNRNTVAQLNPLTGATIKSISPTGDLDGLTFDSFTGKLWVSDFNGGLDSVLTDLSSFQHINGPIGGFDGIASDGAGRLFIASRNDFSIYEYNITGNSFTKRTTVSGLDDLAPLTGLGAPLVVIPEPTSLLLFSFSVGGLALCRRLRRTRALR